MTCLVHDLGKMHPLLTLLLSPTTMRNSEPFHSQMDALFGEYSSVAEQFLWFTSVVSGIMLCRLAYDGVRFVSSVYFATYRKLSEHKKLEWGNRGFSCLHAIFATSTASYLLFISDIFKEEAPYGPVTFRSTIFSQLNVGISMGYFFSDMAVLIRYFPTLGGYEIIIHHVMSIGSLALGMYSGYAHIYLTMVLFSECTTPFLNLRWYFLKAGQKTSLAYKINGLMLLLVWLGARVLMFVYFFLHIHWHYDEVQQLFPLGFYFLFTAPPTLALLNFIWFFKIVAGIITYFFVNKN